MAHQSRLLFLLVQLLYWRPLYLNGNAQQYLLVVLFRQKPLSKIEKTKKETNLKVEVLRDGIVLCRIQKG